MQDNEQDQSVEVGTGPPPEDPPEAMAVATRAPEPPAPLSRVEAIGGMLRPVAEPAQIMEAQEATRDFIEKALKPKRDYDTIPGTKKPTLLKPGAERTAAAFGCHARFTVMEQEVDHDRLNIYMKKEWEWHPSIQGRKVFKAEVPAESHGLYRYVVSCELVHRASNFVVGSGLGSCSTMESKYIDRPRDLENTVLKMAKKRAFIDAVLTTFGLSEQFTQDTEDMPSEHFQKGGGKPKGFSLDGPAAGKDNKGETWRQVCERDPGFILWAIGRKKGTGMDKLTKADRKILSDELERLAGTVPQDAEENVDQSQPQGPDGSDEVHRLTLMETKVGSGKYKTDSWLSVAAKDLTYLDKAMSLKWGEKMLPAGSPIRAAVKWACGGGLERMKLSPTPETTQAPSSVFVQMTTEAKATLAGCQALAKIHPHLPDDMDDWEEDDYEKAVNAFLTAADRGGVTYVLDKAMKKLYEAQAALAPPEEPAPPASDVITAEMVADAQATMARCAEKGMDTKPWEEVFQSATDRGDAGAYRTHLDLLRQAYLAKAANGKGRAQDPAQGAML